MLLAVFLFIFQSEFWRKEVQWNAEYITNIAETDVEKVRLIARWIAEYIEYDVNYNLDTSQTAETVIQNGKAVCAGFCNLFTKSCG